MRTLQDREEHVLVADHARSKEIFMCDDCMLQFVLFMKRPFFKFGEVEEV